MRGAILGLIVLLAIGLFVAIQYGWISFDADRKEHELRIKANPTQAQHDLKAVGAKAEEMGKAIASKAGDVVERAKDALSSAPAISPKPTKNEE
jgi:hypothetical protein